MSKKSVEPCMFLPWRRVVRKLAYLFVVIVGSWPAWSAAAPGGRKAEVDLVSSVKSVIPGSAFDVGIRFRMAEGWHIYWQNPGDAGIPPRAIWKTPAGFVLGGLQFPVPKRHVSPGNIVTNIFEDEAVLLVTITPPPAGVDTRTVTLAGEIKYLICKENCIPETAEVKLELPVASTGDTPQPANDEVFTKAKRKLPARSSKYLTLSSSKVSTATLAAGQDFDITLTIDVAQGIHIQSHQPLQPTLVKSDILMERTEGVFFEKPVFPPGKLRPVKGLGDVSEYAGQVTIRIPGKVDDPAPGGPLRFAGLFLYQACNEQGTCFPPDALAFSVGTSGTDPLKGQGSAPVPRSSIPFPTGRPVIADEAESRSFLGWLAFAFLGGLILNVMPCVLPVISIKVLSLVQQADERPAKIFRLGMTFVAGVIVSFIALAVVVIVLKSAGKPFGWGSQFQHPWFLISMSALVFLFGLSLFGVFTVSLPGAAFSKLAAAEGHEGYVGAFMKGLLGTILATPCTAPFLGPALGWAFTARNDQLLAVFATVGLGMASPFIVLALKPNWVRHLPRPGLWMEHFKQFMGFLLMGTVIWLLYSLGSLIGPFGLILTLSFLTCLGLSAWLIGKQTPLTPPGRKIVGWMAALAIAFTGWFVPFGRAKSSLAALQEEYRNERHAPTRVVIPSRPDWADEIPWQPWSKGMGEKLSAQGYTVYVDYTADWCANCLTNKKVTLETEAVRGKMAELCVVPLKADNTAFDQDIADDLARFGRAGVPLNIIFPAGNPDAPIILPELLVGRTPLILEKLQDSGPSRQCGPMATAASLPSGT